MNLYLGQTCDAQFGDGRHAYYLRVVAYAYAIQPQSMDDRLMRWEFVRFPGDSARWCRHHLQGPITFDILDHRNALQTINLNDWHLPTGWVSIEEVLRFCLHDLGARALVDSDVWHQPLVESQSLFQRRNALSQR